MHALACRLELTAALAVARRAPTSPPASKPPSPNLRLSRLEKPSQFLYVVMCCSQLTTDHRQLTISILEHELRRIHKRPHQIFGRLPPRRPLFREQLLADFQLRRVRQA